ncbi:MAG TPA: type II toxin-antitoxin system RelE/ParE family toxin [Allosphingosinicella sp.]
MKVRITQAALADLRDIGHWIALDDPERAITFVQELAEKCLSLSDRPSPIRPRPRRVKASGSDGIANPDPLPCRRGDHRRPALSEDVHATVTLFVVAGAPRGLSLTQGFCIIFRG